MRVSTVAVLTTSDGDRNAKLRAMFTRSNTRSSADRTANVPNFTKISGVLQKNDKTGACQTKLSNAIYRKKHQDRAVR